MYALPVQDLSADRILVDAKRNADGQPVLGGIHLKGKLDQASHSLVYHGVRDSDGDAVVVRVQKESADPVLMQRFIREGRAAAGISSPNLIAVFDINQESGLCFIVQELVAGPTADRYLEEQGGTGLETAEALAIIQAACTGAAAAHEEGIIHRNITPANIVIPADADAGALHFGAAKLTDLGYAKISDGHLLTGRNALLGTPGYLPPEQISDPSNVTPAADVFGLGATLYRLLTGKFPFDATSPTKLLILCARGDVMPVEQHRSDLPPGVVDLVNRCIQGDAGARPADAAAMLAEMQGLT